jgi:ATP-dependent protease ClpP protease subunit
MAFTVSIPASGLIGYINRQTLMVYGDVQEGDEVEIRTLFDGQEDEYQIIINTPGGSAFTCMSIAQHIKSLQDAGAKVTTEVAGMASSAGAIIWIMGDERIVHKHDMIMFHSVQFYDLVTGETIPEHELSEGDILIKDTLNSFMVERLTKVIGKKKAESMLEGENWLTGQQAFDMGLATILK